jgi:hypothetical protein
VEDAFRELVGAKPRRWIKRTVSWIMGSHWHFVRLVRVTSYLFFGSIIVAAVQSMVWRRKKLEMGNQLPTIAIAG